MIARSLPSTRTLTGTVGALAAVGAMLSVPFSSAVATSALPAARPAAAEWCAAQGELAVEAMPTTISPATCDLSGRTLVAGSVRIDVPAAGHGVSASDGAANGESMLRVFTAGDGVVTIVRDEHSVGAAAFAAPKAAVSTSSAACRDQSFSGMGYKFNGTFTWKRNGTGTPKQVGASAATAMLTATADVARGTNRCGQSRPVKLKQTYTGLTSLKPQVTSSGSCYSKGDGVSVTGWMKLPKVLAYTCSYYRWNGKAWVVSESDMALSTSFNWFTSASAPRGCRYTFDLRGVIAHERGHTFGLGHVASSSSLTMSPYSKPCTTANRTLGYGDYRGLSSMYGVS